MKGEPSITILITTKKSAWNGHPAEDLVGCREGSFELLIGGIEVRGEAYAGIGTPVHEDIALEHLVRYFARVRHIDAHGSTALRRIARRIDLPSSFVGQTNQLGSLPL